MRNEHLNTEELNLLSNGKLTGKPLAKALLHIEECNSCQAKVATPNATQLFSAIFAATSSKGPENQLIDTLGNANSKLWAPFISSRRRLNFGLGAACAAILVTIIGATWFSFPFAKFSISEKTSTAISSVNQTTDQNELAAGVSPQAGEATNPAAESPARLPQIETAVINNSKSTLGKKQQRRQNVSINANLNSSPKNNTKINREPNRLISVAPQSFTKADQKELNEFLTKLPTVLASLRPAATNLRSGGSEKIEDSFGLLTPQGEVIRETQPYFKWQRVENAARYKILTYDHNYNQIVSQTTESNSYQSRCSLKRGKTYLWQVKAQTPNGEVVSPRPPASPALFRVASDKTIASLRRLTTQKSSWKLISILLREGLLGEAETELNKLLKRSSQDQLAQSLLNRVQALRNDTTIENITQTVNPNQ